MDIDYFHNVNVTYGWPTGDHVLRIFSKIASENIRLVDWLARYGGEEFCVVMLDTELEQAISIAERIREAVAASNVQSLDNRPVGLTVSIGVAKLSDEIDSPVSLVQKASKSLIFAKESGRNRVCYNQ
jgi:two-component system, cell cycle response regulator